MNAASEYAAKEQATRLLTAKLRAERLAREAKNAKREQKGRKRLSHAVGSDELSRKPAQTDACHILSLCRCVCVIRPAA